MGRQVLNVAACLFLFAGTEAWSETAAPSNPDTANIPIAVASTRRLPPSDVSYRLLITHGKHKNAGTGADVSVEFLGTQGSFKVPILPANTSFNYGWADGIAMGRMEWLLPATSQLVKDVGPIAGLILNCWGCDGDDFQYGPVSVEYRQTGRETVTSSFSKAGWLASWEGYSNSATLVEDDLDPNAKRQPVDCGEPGRGCQVAEFFKVIDLRSSAQDKEERFTVRHTLSVDDYSRFITETRNTVEISVDVRARLFGVAESSLKGEYKHSTEETKENSKRIEETKYTETEETVKVPKGYLVIFHEVLMAKGTYTPSGKFNLGTEMGEVTTTNQQWLYFTNDDFGELRPVEWRQETGNSDASARVLRVLERPIPKKYLKLLRERGFLDEEEAQ